MRSDLSEWGPVRCTTSRPSPRCSSSSTRSVLDAGGPPASRGCSNRSMLRTPGPAGADDHGLHFLLGALFPRRGAKSVSTLPASTAIHTPCLADAIAGLSPLLLALTWSGQMHAGPLAHDEGTGALLHLRTHVFHNLALCVLLRRRHHLVLDARHSGEFSTPGHWCHTCLCDHSDSSVLSGLLAAELGPSIAHVDGGPRRKSRRQHC